MTGGPSPRVVVIGLDGADWTALEKLFADGAMPTLKAFVDSGARSTLESVLPTNSMSAWTSLMTGVNPGKHGVYDFVRRTNTPFKTFVTNSSVIRFPTIWETLTAAGLRSCVIDMPPLYPPFKINGVMLGGIAAMTSTGRPYAWPPEAAARVEAAVGRFLPDVPWVGKAGRQEEVVADLTALVDNRRQVTEAMLDDGPADVFCSIFVAPDRLQHILWQDVTDQGPLYPLARGFYAALDEALARVLDRLDLTQTDVLIVSDHGFRRFAKTFDVNQYLLETGLLRWRWKVSTLNRALRAVRAVARPLAGRIGRMLERPNLRPRRELLPGTVAYSDISDGVSVNLAGRETTGEVPERDFHEVRERVAAKLLEFRDPESGQPVVRRLTRREEYFRGPYAADAPDLVVECHDGYAYNSGLGRLMFRWTYCQGVHSLNGIIAAAGPHFRPRTQVPLVSILDVAPTVLSLLGVPAPEGTEGRVARELLKEAPAPPSGPPAPPSEGRGEPTAFSEDEEERVRERLRGLGYID